ncbi:EAL domain-containing protein [Vibrio mexicanus]|uniref:EAL domain-containing protein n=1 Tax=Vibrio mexicanus TaxID=1004326 RepID=UPI000949A1C5|nr:EAL domain-containing protein [Vibrio mexicanus]
MPFSSPIFINGWLATEGDFSAVFLQLFNVALSALIYFPAVMALNSTLRDRDIGFSSLDTTYSRRYEEAQTLSNDYLMREKAQNQRRDRIERELKHYSQKEFCLEYQPQVCSKSGRVVGCEALIRAIDDSGKVEYPGAFLPWFEKAE